MINFTSEQRTRLQALIGELTFSGETFAGKFGSTQYTPWDFINTCTANVCETAYNAAKRTRAAAEKDDPWATDSTDSERIAQLQRWEDFLFLVWGYNRWKLEDKIRQAKKEALSTKLADLKEENKTPAEKIAELEAELAAM